MSRIINWNDIHFNRLSTVEETQMICAIAEKVITKKYVIDDIINVLDVMYDISYIDKNNYVALHDMLTEIKFAIDILHKN